MLGSVFYSLLYENKDIDDDEGEVEDENFNESFQKYILFLKLKEFEDKFYAIKFKDTSDTETKNTIKLLEILIEFYHLFKFKEVMSISNKIFSKLGKLPYDNKQF